VLDRQGPVGFDAPRSRCYATTGCQWPTGDMFVPLLDETPKPRRATFRCSFCHSPPYYPSAFSSLKLLVTYSLEKNIRHAFDHLVDPVLVAIRRELSAIIARLHRIDFGKNVDPMSGMGGASLYMKDLAEKLSFIKGEILSKYNVGETGRIWFVCFCL
jgi:hypothetical protein